MSSQTVTLDVRDDIRSVTDIKMEAIVTREPGPSFTRQIATLLLSKEHGSWSLALEPLAFGFLLATRTFWLLGESRFRFAPKIVGTMKMILGVAMVLTLAVAWKFF